MRQKATVTAVVVTYNAERFIRGCLECVKGWVDEIIVADMFSTDRTVEIARGYTDKIFQDNGTYLVRSNIGIDKATSDWILIVNATERITKVLKSEIIERINEKESCAGYHVPRLNYLYGRFMEERPGPLYLFKRGAGRYLCTCGTHETIPIKGKVGHLKNFKIHYSSITINDLIDKGNRFTSYDAKVVFAGNPRAFGCKLAVYKANLFNLVYRTVLGFFSSYILSKGYKYGMHGFIISVFGAFWNFIEIAKLYELQYKKEHNIDDTAIPLDSDEEEKII